ncbi:LLM class flavin-dependent oxidoreductase [Chloroflexi bacterium TSY]|nr:LLM class flavin-dependent oxidoreductase [Chloroflexi bacterium TSY]
MVAGDRSDFKRRTIKIDEGLEIITQLWQGNSFSHQGRHYQVDTASLQFNVPSPVQQPRIPIWVVGAWPRPKSMRRGLKCDGVIPMVKPKGEKGREITPRDVREMKAWIEEHNKSPLDIVIEGETPGNDPNKAQATVQTWAEAGATWWIESIWGNPSRQEARLRQGPPSHLE